jgi:hypothetical protein
LTKTIHNDCWVIGEIPFDINNHYTIVQTKQEEFDFYTNKLLNEPLTTICRWNCTLLQDVDNNISRLYFKIDHSYCDGYKLIEMLTTTLYPTFKNPSFKRQWVNLVSVIYYFIVGTIYLFFMNMWILLKHFIVKQQKETSKIDYSKNKALNLFCGNIDINLLKQISAEYDVTLNTVLYSLMVKTWYYYKYKKGNAEAVLSGSPININTNPKEYHTNNIFCIFVDTECYESISVMMKKVDDTFNLYKRSLYVLLANKFISTCFSLVPKEISNQLFQETYASLDFLYTNIIGPKIEEPQTIAKLTNVQYTTATYTSEACFNIISYENTVNVNLSYREGVIKNKKKFLRSFQKACTEIFDLIQ